MCWSDSWNSVMDGAYENHWALNQNELLLYMFPLFHVGSHGRLRVTGLVFMKIKNKVRSFVNLE